MTTLVSCAQMLTGGAVVDHQRLTYVTERYAHLQGLRLVPLGLVFLASATWRAGYLSWLPAVTGHTRIWFFASVGVAIGLSFVIRVWYQRRIGWYLGRPTRTGATTLGMSVVGFGALALVPPTAWPVSWPALYVAALLAILGVVERGLRRHYLAISAGCLLYACARILGASAHTRDVGLDVLIGVGLIVAGVGDHLVLERARPAPEGDPYVRRAR